MLLLPASSHPVIVLAPPLLPRPPVAVLWLPPRIPSPSRVMSERLRSGRARPKDAPPRQISGTLIQGSEVNGSDPRPGFRGRQTLANNCTVGRPVGEQFHSRREKTLLEQDPRY